MNITVQPKIDPELVPSEIQSRSRAVITDFSEARHQLMPECRHTVRDRAARAVQNVCAQRQVLSGSSELFEQAFYWLLTAPALVYVVYLAFGF
jgi:hypothetical protein